MGKAPGTMRRYSYAEPKMTKSDFEWEAQEKGFTVEVRKVKREGWNDSREFWVTKDGVSEKVEDVTKGEGPNWRQMFEHVAGVKRSWLADFVR